MRTTHLYLPKPLDFGGNLDSRAHTTNYNTKSYEIQTAQKLKVITAKLVYK
jgi:hypothetical protein